MSPLSVALPPPNVEFLERFFYPAMVNFDPNTTIGSTSFAFWRPMPMLGGDGSSQNLAGLFAAGSGGVIQQYERHKGRGCARWSMTVADTANGQGWAFPSWYPSFGDGTGTAVGMKANPASVVGVFDFHVAVGVAGTLFGDGRTGLYFMPQGNAASVTTSGPITGSFGGSGGFGVFINDSATAPGTNVLEYMAWAQSPGIGLPPTVLERVQISLAVVPDITDWSTVRFIIVGAKAGSPATLSVECNGFPILTAREFGSAFLNTPNVADFGNLSNRWGVAPVIRDLTGSANPMFFAVSGKWGRFTPDGAEQQAI